MPKKRQTGRQRIYHHTDTKATVVVPFHGRDIPSGTQRSIIPQSKLDTDEFEWKLF